MMSEMIEQHVGVGPNGPFEFVVLRGELGEAVLWDVTYPATPGISAFLEDFEIDPGDYLGDPAEDHYQGTTFTRLIRRRVDGATFGQTYWYNPGIDAIDGTVGDSVELAAELGVQIDPDEPFEPVIFVPVKRFERVGYTPVNLLTKDG